MKEHAHTHTKGFYEMFRIESKNGCCQEFGKKGMENDCLVGYRVSFVGDENIWELDVIFANSVNLSKTTS